MKKPHQTILKFFVLLLAFLCLGWADSLDGLKKAAGRLNSVSARFTQEKHMKILARPLVSKGRFYFQAPNSLRWEYLEPIRSILMVNQGEIKKYTQKDNKLVEDSGAHLQSMQIVLQQISGWLKGRFDDNPLFTTRLTAARTIVMVPKEESFARFIQKIVLVLTEQTGVIENVTIYESADSYTLLSFENVRPNEKISESLFKDI